MKFAVLKLLLFSAFTGMALSASATMDLCSARKSSLEFVLRSQSQSDSDIYKKGEWPSKVLLGGLGKSLGLLKTGGFEDRNLFTTASIHNVLAEIYLKYNHDKRIPKAMDWALRASAVYKMADGTYNFWPKANEFKNEVHLPRFALTSGLVEGVLAIPGDADDTAVLELAKYMNRVVCLRSGRKPSNCVSLTENIENHFSPFTDGVRLPAPSNLLRAELGTGAYLTWLQPEPILPFPLHAFAPQNQGARIVLDKNDVDCVVNANVLRTLSLYAKTNAKGYSQACRLLQSDAEDIDFNSCGDYYPDTYWYHYALARAFSDGATCLRRASELAIEHLLSHQAYDGSWHNELLAKDDILATAFALGALLKIGNQNNPVEMKAVRLGLRYLMSQMQLSKEALAYWPGGVFFSAGVPARTDVLWFSDSFTTSIVSLVLYDSLAWLPARNNCQP